MNINSKHSLLLPKLFNAKHTTASTPRAYNKKKIWNLDCKHSCDVSERCLTPRSKNLKPFKQNKKKIQEAIFSHTASKNL